MNSERNDGCEVTNDALFCDKCNKELVKQKNFNDNLDPAMIKSKCNCVNDNISVARVVNDNVTVSDVSVANGRTLELEAKKFIYVNKNTVPNSVAAYTVDNTGFVTSLLGSPFATNGNGSNNAFYGSKNELIATNGKYLHIGNAADNTISVFSINKTTGNLTLVPGSPFATGNIGGTIMSLAGTPNGKFLYVSSCNSLDIDSTLTNIVMFSVNAITGVLTNLGKFLYPFTSRINGMAVTPNGKFLVAALIDINMLASFAIGTNGLLTNIGAVTGANISVTITNSGNFVYSCQGGGNRLSIGIFTINLSGILTFIGLFSDYSVGFYNNGQFSSVSPDDRFLYVSGNVYGGPVVLSGADTGVLTKLALYPATASVLYPMTNANGKLLYILGANGNTNIYKVATDGTLTLLNSFVVPDTLTPCIETFPK